MITKILLQSKCLQGNNTHGSIHDVLKAQQTTKSIRTFPFASGIANRVISFHISADFVQTGEKCRWLLQKKNRYRVATWVQGSNNFLNQF
jgi:hypothetical protein